MKKRKKYVLFFIVIIFLGSVLIGLMTAKLYVPKNHVVSLTKDGFEPDTILIAKGDTITWVNTHTRSRWPSSNSHPTHTEYKTLDKGCIGSALDACRGLKRGEEYAFNFDRTGVFGMHDHLLPGDTMVVKVINKTSYLFNYKKENTALTGGMVNTPDITEFRDLDYGQKRVVIRKLAKKDPAAAWRYLIKAAKENEEVIFTAHEFAHIVGRESFKQDGFEGIDNCSNDFAFGCFHGVTEQMLLTHGKDHLTTIENECLKHYPTSEGELIHDAGCIHGMGHALLTLNNLDINAALKDCDKLSPGIRASCWDGVFMEYSFSELLSFDSKDPWKFCREMHFSYQGKCATYIGQMYLESVSFDSYVFSTMCMQAPHQQLETLCMRWIGYMVAENSASNLDFITNECRRIKNNEASITCLVGAAQEIAFQRYPNWEKVAQSVCSQVPEEYVEECSTYGKN